MITIQSVRARVDKAVQTHPDLSGLIDEAIAQFEAGTGRLFAERTDHVQKFHFYDLALSVLFLELDNVTEITSVRTRYSLSDSWTTLESDDYELVDNALYKVSGTWPNHVEVTYSGGYAEAPGDIKNALIIQVGFLAERDQRASLSSQNFEGGAGVFLGADYHPRFKKVVQRYQRLV